MIDFAPLRADALAARAAGDLDRAVRGWRALLDAAPDDWTLALELKRDLEAGLHVPDGDMRFRRAARSLPDAHWLAHYAGRAMLHGSDLEAVDARGRALLTAGPGDARLHAVLGEVARQRRDWTGAVEAFSAAARLEPGVAEYGPKAAMARLYARLRWPHGGVQYSVLVLNLDRNAERMVEIGRQFAGCAAPWRRLPGVDGGRLPKAAVRAMAGAEGWPGTLGCFLSHTAAWEALLASEEAMTLVVEDDAIPLLDLPARLALPLPEGWDVVWVNDRMAPAMEPDGVDAFTVQALAARMQGFDRQHDAVGTDGYLISRAGAAKLLAWVAEDGWADDVDWRMAAYGMTPAEVEAVPPSHARSELGRVGARNPRRERLQAHVLFPPLIRTVGITSDRWDVNAGNVDRWMAP